MPLHDAVGVNYKNGTISDIKVQVPSIWIQGEYWTIVHAESD